MEQNIQQRLRELAVKIVAEQDQDKFTALVKEFNALADEQRQKTKGLQSPAVDA